MEKSRGNIVVRMGELTAKERDESELSNRSHCKSYLWIITVALTQSPPLSEKKIYNVVCSRDIQYPAIIYDTIVRIQIKSK